MTDREFWVEDDEIQLRRLYQRGLTIRDIATRMSKSPSAVHRHAQKLGLTFEAEKTEKATAVRLAIVRAKRADLLEWLTDRALTNARRLDTHPFITCTRTPTGAVTNELPYVPADDELALARAISIMVSTIERLAKLDTDITDEDKSVVARLRIRLEEIREARATDDTTTTCENTET